MVQTGKRRFGVSISNRLAAKLDVLASRLGSDRSSLVERALEEFVHDRLHIIEPHHCEGILVVKHEKELSGDVSNVIERYSDIVKAILHVHGRNYECIRILHLEGKSTRIIELERRLKEKGVKLTRYLVL